MALGNGFTTVMDFLYESMWHNDPFTNFYHLSRNLQAFPAYPLLRENPRAAGVFMKVCFLVRLLLKNS